MEILIFGAGAVGGYLGARLSHSGHAVTLVSRRPAAEDIQRNGLTLMESGQRLLTRPNIFPTLREAIGDDNHYDLVILCVKSYDAQAALYELVAFYGTAPAIITMQNGIGIEELFAEELGPERIIAGSLTTPLSHETSNSIVVERSDRGLGLAPAQAGLDIQQWVTLFEGAGLDTVAFDDYRSLKWSKALVNMIGNASAAILNRHPKVVYSYGPTFKMEMDMLKETLNVMKANDIATVDLPGVSTRRLSMAVRRLPKSVVKPILTNIVGSGRGNKMPSFHIDLMSGREQNEVTYHNGAVADAGQVAGLPTPVNKALNDILTRIAKKEIDYQIFNGRPKYLVSEVDKYRK
jgi:2-dehydropantoate 2-reductase